MLNLEFQKLSFFTSLHFSLYWKVYFSPWVIGSVKSSSTNNNEPNKPNPKSLAHVGSEKLLVELGVPKNELFHFFSHFSLYWKLYFFTLGHGFVKVITYREFVCLTTVWGGGLLILSLSLFRQSIWHCKLPFCLSRFLFVRLNCLFGCRDSHSLANLKFLDCRVLVITGFLEKESGNFDFLEGFKNVSKSICGFCLLLPPPL